MSDMSAAPQGQDPSQQQAQPTDDGNDEVCVEISVNTKTGEIKFGLESNDDATETGDGDDDSNMQPAKSLDEAFTKARQMLEQAMGGQGGQGAPSSPADAAAFEQGYQNVSQGTGGSGY